MPRRPPTLVESLPALIDPAVGDDEVLEEVELSGRFTPGEIAGLKVRDCRLRDVVLTGSVLSSTEWRNCVVARSELSGLMAEDGSFTRVEFDDCRMTGAVFAAANLQHVRFRGCRLDQAVFRMATASELEFEDCELRGADFQGARFEGVRFAGCSLGGADVSHARLRGADLRGSELAGLIGGRSLVGVRINVTQVTDVAFSLFASLGIVVESPSRD